MKSNLAIAAALFASIVLFAHAADERSALPDAMEEPIPASYFGMTMNSPLTTPWPAIDFASLRTWDMNISWADISPERGRYDWTKFDAIVALAASHGIELIYTFGRTPQWAARAPNARSAYGPGQCSPPAQLSDWADFVRAVVARADGRIRFWELWNEPQDRKFYCGDISTMLKLEKAAYEIIKSHDNLQVLTPSPTGGLGPAWMSDFLSAGGGNYADVIAFHGYWDANARSLPALVARFRAVVQQAGEGKKPIWDTEAGWGQTSAGMDPSRQAAFLAKYFLLHWALGIQRLYWYSYDNELGWGTLWDRKTGLRQAGIAYREVRSWMLGATMVDRCAPASTSDPIWVCGLARPGGYRAQAVWTEGDRQSYRTGDRFLHYRDLDGHRHAIQNGVVEISSSPILLES